MKMLTMINSCCRLASEEEIQFISLTYIYI
uniref:Uncharacterized protein n=1 Tax=Heterorhabditis bacteriophora TaxID=37862 RepID=A0A1I7WXW0_HETBA